MVPILKEAQAGVLKAQPKAKSIIHLSQWNNVDSPEWYDGGLWDAFALFDAHGVARPGTRSFLP